MTAQQRTLDDLKRGVNVQIDKGGHIRYRLQPQMGLPSVQIIDKSVVTQLETALEWYKEIAEAMKRYAEAKPPKTISMTAIVTELSLDGGKRALVALGGE